MHEEYPTTTRVAVLGYAHSSLSIDISPSSFQEIHLRNYSILIDN